MVDVGLIETMRARDGRVPWLGRHLARMRASATALRLAHPPADIADLTRIAAAGAGGLFTPAEELGILPGIGRSRILELAGVQEARAPVSDLAGRSMFLVNAVRGVVEIGSLQGQPASGDPRTAELSSAFWPD